MMSTNALATLRGDRVSISRARYIGLEICGRIYAGREEAKAWRVSSLGGNSGIALLLASAGRAYGELRWVEGAHELLASAAQDQARLVGLYSGISGLLFAAALLDKATLRYGRLRRQIVQLIDSFSARPDIMPAKPTTEHFDLIRGLAGVVIALSVNGDDCAALDRFCSYLSWLCADSERWYAATPKSLGFDMPCHNIGMSHGITGVLAALAISKGHRPAAAAIDELFTWFKHKSSGEPNLALWPAIGERPFSENNRAAWCYGTPGVGAALILAGHAFGDAQVFDLGCESIRRLAIAPSESWHLADFALCHGLAGNALCFYTIGRAIDDPKVSQTGARLFDALMDRYQADAMYGFRSVLNDGTEGDDPGFLSGAAGIAMALLTYAGLVDFTWVKALGLPSQRLA